MKARHAMPPRDNRTNMTTFTAIGPSVEAPEPADLRRDRPARIPRVSVCIPTYRGEETIAATIDSVLAQSYADFELLVIDDGSPDATQAIVESIVDPRLVYLRNDRNLGPQGNWNRCLELARGDYVKVLPHDDLLRPDCLAQQVRVLDADTDQHIAMVFCARDVIGPHGRVLTQRGYPRGREGVVAAAELIRACVRRGTNLIGEPGGVLFRRSLAERVGPFDASNPYVIDLDYWFRLLAHGDGHYSPERLAAFRVSRSQWSVAIGTGQSTDFRRFIARTSAHKPLPTTALDRFWACFTPGLNNLARLIFYRLYLR